MSNDNQIACQEKGKTYCDLEPSLSYWIKCTSPFEEPIEEETYISLAVAIASANPKTVMQLHTGNSGIWHYTIDPMEADILCIEYSEITYHLMIALARGLIIVHPKWLAAVNRNHVITYMPEHYFQSDTFLSNWTNNIQQVCFAAQKHKIFEGDLFIMAPYITIFYSKIKGLVKAAGGKVDSLIYDENNITVKGEIFFVADITYEKEFIEKYMEKNKNFNLIKYHNIIYTIFYYNRSLMKSDTEKINNKFPNFLAHIFGDNNYTSYTDSDDDDDNDDVNVDVDVDDADADADADDDDDDNYEEDSDADFSDLERENYERYIREKSDLEDANKNLFAVSNGSKDEVVASKELEAPKTNTEDDKAKNELEKRNEDIKIISISVLQYIFGDNQKEKINQYLKVFEDHPNEDPCQALCDIIVLHGSRLSKAELKQILHIVTAYKIKNSGDLESFMATFEDEPLHNKEQNQNDNEKSENNSNSLEIVEIETVYGAESIIDKPFESTVDLEIKSKVPKEEVLPQQKEKKMIPIINKTEQLVEPEKIIDSSNTDTIQDTCCYETKEQIIKAKDDKYEEMKKQREVINANVLKLLDLDLESSEDEEEYERNEQSKRKNTMDGGLPDAEAEIELTIEDREAIAEFERESSGLIEQIMNLMVDLETKENKKITSILP